MVRSILRFGAPELQRPAAPFPARLPDPAAHRRHGRDDVRGAGHRPGGAAARRSAAHLRRRSVGRTVGDGPARDRQSRDSWSASGMQLEEEGCLSLPGFTATVLRPQRASSCAPRIATGASSSSRARGCSHARSSTRSTISTAPLFVDRLRGIKRAVDRRARFDEARGASADGDPRAACASCSSARPTSRCRRCAPLLDSRHLVVGVVSQPDRPRGRGQQRLRQPGQGGAAREHRPVLQPEKMRDEVFLARCALGRRPGRRRRIWPNPH